MTNGSLKLAFLCNDSLLKTAFLFWKGENMVDVFLNGDTRLLTDQDVPGSEFNLLDKTATLDYFAATQGNGNIEKIEGTPAAPKSSKTAKLMHLWGTSGGWTYNSPLSLDKGNYTLSFIYSFFQNDEQNGKNIFTYNLSGDQNGLATAKISGSTGKSVCKKVVKFYIPSFITVSQLSFTRNDNLFFPGGTMYIEEVKLETGSIATPYCGSMNDLTDRITALESRLGG